MFIGHFALGLAAKRATPNVSLAVLFTAAQLADTLWPIFLATDLEQVRIDPGNTAFTPLDFISYPYSHSLILLVAWGLAMAIVCRAFVRDRWVVPVIAGLVVSHWVLDVITHRPDMPIYPGGPKVGLGLWNSVAGTMAVEVPMFLVGVWLYTRSTRSRDGIGRWAFLSLVAVLLLIYVGNVFGPPPPSLRALVVTMVIGIPVFTAWSWWADCHREAVGVR